MFSLYQLHLKYSQWSKLKGCEVNREKCLEKWICSDLWYVWSVYLIHHADEMPTVLSKISFIHICSIFMDIFLITSATVWIHVGRHVGFFLSKVRLGDSHFTTLSFTLKTNWSGDKNIVHNRKLLLKRGTFFSFLIRMNIFILWSKWLVEVRGQN